MASYYSDLSTYSADATPGKIGTYGDSARKRGPARAQSTTADGAATGKTREIPDSVVSPARSGTCGDSIRRKVAMSETARPGVISPGNGEKNRDSGLA